MSQISVMTILLLCRCHPYHNILQKRTVRVRLKFALSFATGSQDKCKKITGFLRISKGKMYTYAIYNSNYLKETLEDR